MGGALRAPVLRVSARCALLVALLAGAPAAFPAVPAAAGKPPEAAVRRILADRKYQREIPGHAASRGTEAAAPRHERPPRRPFRISLPDFGGLAAIAKVLFWALVAVIALVLLAWIGNLLFARFRKAGGPLAESVPEAPPAGAPVAEPTLEEANRLAREGRFGEAVHVLLLASIRRLAERGRRALQPHQTSRELLRSLPLGPESRQAFRDLVVTVEGAHFGGAEIGEGDYARSLDRYRALTDGRADGA